MDTRQLGSERAWKKISKLNEETERALRARLTKEIRKNTYNKKTGVITVSPVRAAAIANLGNYYSSSTDDPKLDKIRDDYAMQKNVIKNPDRLHSFISFLWWATWSAKQTVPATM